MQQLALDTEDETRAGDDLRGAQGAVGLDAVKLADPSVAIANEINQPLAAIIASAYACTRWLTADPPNIERARLAAERIIRDANAAAETTGRLRRGRRPRPVD